MFTLILCHTDTYEQIYLHINLIYSCRQAIPDMDFIWIICIAPWHLFLFLFCSNLNYKPIHMLQTHSHNTNQTTLWTTIKTPSYGVLSIIILQHPIPSWIGIRWLSSNKKNVAFIQFFKGRLTTASKPEFQSTNWCIQFYGNFPQGNTLHLN